MIAINHLAKSYGSQSVLEGISMNFSRGKVYGIVGENGAGKTTLFKCIAGLENYEGQIESDFVPLKDHLGYLSTIPFFFSKLTGNEYLRLLCAARSVDFSNDQFDLFDLPLDRYVSTYSTGMKKKLALWALLLQKNDVYILDEPFSGVDIQSNALIVSIIKRLRELDKIILISSHIYSTLAETCDEILFLKDKRFEKIASKESFNEIEAMMLHNSTQQNIENLEL